MTWTFKVKKDGSFSGLKLPEGAHTAILCSNDGTGLKPLAMLLTQELNAIKLQAYLDSDPSIKQLTAIPVTFTEYIHFIKDVNFCVCGLTEDETAALKRGGLDPTTNFKVLP